MIKTKYRVTIEIDASLENIEEVEERIKNYINCSGYVYRNETMDNEFTNPTVVDIVQIDPKEEEDESNT